MSKGKVMQVAVEIAGNISPTLAKALEETGSRLGKLNLKAIAVGTAAVAGTAMLVKGTIEAGKYLADLGGRFDEVSDTIRIGTGATGEKLEALNADFNEVYKGVPTSMEDASKAIADFNTRLDLSGPALQGVSKQALQVSDMLGDDLGGVIEESSKAFKAWDMDAESMGHAMDFVFKASQSTGAGFTGIMDKVQKFRPQLEELGYSFEKSAVFMGRLEKEGFNVEEVLAGVKKGVVVFAKEGLSASAGLEKYANQIKNAKTQTEAIAIASKVFGSKAASTMSDAIRKGALSVDELTESLMKNQETIGGAAEDTYDFAERLQMFKQQAEVALRPLAASVFDNLNSIMPILAGAMEKLMPVISELVDVLGPLVTEIFANLIDAIGPILPVIVQIAGSILKKLLPPVLKLISSVLPVALKVLGALMPVLEIVATLLAPIIDLITALIVPILDVISTALGPLIDIINMLINVAIVPLKAAIGLLSVVFSAVFGGIAETVGSVFENIKGIFQGIIDFVVNVFTGNWAGAWEAVKSIFSNIIQGLSNIFKAPINWIIKGINAFIGGLNKIKIPDWVPLLGGKGINIPLIPELAAGGFTEGLSIAGEAGTEAVISFNKRYRDDNIGYWQEAGKLLGVYDIAETTNNISNTYSYENIIANSALERTLSVDRTYMASLLENVIPAYKTGGFTSGPSLVGEAGMEAVISFDPVYRDRNIAYWEKAGQMLGTTAERLPRFATGGFTSGPSLAGEAGLEAIISFDPAYREENISYLATAGRLLGIDDFSLGSISQSKIIIYQFGDVYFEASVTSTGDPEKDKEIIKLLKDHEDEFKDKFEEWFEEFQRRREEEEFEPTGSRHN